MLEADPPAALLLGFEPKLEEPLLAYAEENGYRPLSGFQISDRYGKGLLVCQGMARECPRPMRDREIAASHFAKTALCE